MSKSRIYIAGPMRGKCWYNFPAFNAERDKWLNLGWDVLSPADMDIKAGFDPFKLSADHDWSSWPVGMVPALTVERCIEALVKCSDIIMLPGWQQSKGATAEYRVALWCGIHVSFADAHDSPMEEDILAEASRITKGDRQNQYGPPSQDFTRTAAMWSSLKGVQFTAREVAMFMIALKLSRESHQCKRDNWVDIAGYAKCGSLCE